MSEEDNGRIFGSWAAPGPFGPPCHCRASRGGPLPCVCVAVQAYAGRDELPNDAEIDAALAAREGT